MKQGAGDGSVLGMCCSCRDLIVSSQHPHWLEGVGGGERFVCTRPALPFSALFFKAVALTEPGAKLAASKPQPSCQHTLIYHRKQVIL